MITVKPVPRDDLIDLRLRVLRPGKPRAAALFPGDDEPRTRHYGALIDGRVVGCASFMWSELDGAPAWQLRAMASDPDCKGQGVGRALLEQALADVTRASGVRQFWCNARTSALGFYQKLGWTICSDEFEIPEIGPHFKMRWSHPDGGASTQPAR